MTDAPSAPRARLDGIVAVVTRAASVIGQACAVRLAADGATVLVDGDQTVEEIRSQCEARWGRIDALVNCHSLSERTTIEEAPPDLWQRSLDENLLAPLTTTLAFLPLLKASAHGAVVLLGSIDGALGNPHVPAYSVAKGALVPLVHVMADEFAAHGIRVNAVARAAVDDPQGDPGDPVRAALVAATPLGRAAAPDDVARAIAFLASPDAAYITGTVLTVDGGRTAITPGTRRPS